MVGEGRGERGNGGAVLACLGLFAASISAFHRYFSASGLPTFDPQWGAWYGISSRGYANGAGGSQQHMVGAFARNLFAGFRLAGVFLSLRSFLAFRVSRGCFNSGGGNGLANLAVLSAYLQGGFVLLALQGVRTVVLRRENNLQHDGQEGNATFDGPTNRPTTRFHIHLGYGLVYSTHKQGGRKQNTSFSREGKAGVGFKEWDGEGVQRWGLVGSFFSFTGGCWDVIRLMGDGGITWVICLGGVFSAKTLHGIHHPSLTLHIIT